MGDTALMLFTEGDALYADMLAAIGAARDRVWLETYIFSADEVGWQFAEALTERARAGVNVRLQVDSAGALESPYSKRIRRYLVEAGVELRWFNRLRRLLPAQLNHRDHRKLLMVDTHRLYVGSSNISKANSRRLHGSLCRYNYDVRIDGALAKRMATLGTALWEGKHDSEPGWQTIAEDDSQLVASSPSSRERPLRALYNALFEQARSSVHLAVGYFVPDEDTVRAVERAARRGIDVRLMLAGRTDVPITRWAGHAFYARLLKIGVRLYEYTPAMPHMKAAVTDRAWATLGSANMDFRSFFLNYELNLETRDTAFCQELHGVILGDLECCEEITAPAWSRRPWSARAKEKLVWPARRYL